VQALLNDKSIQDAARNAELRELRCLNVDNVGKPVLEATVFPLWPRRVRHDSLVAVVGEVPEADMEDVLTTAAAAASSSPGTLRCARGRALRLCVPARMRASERSRERERESVCVRAIFWTYLYVSVCAYVRVMLFVFVCMRTCACMCVCRFLCMWE
jgi:hypothetical protein